MRDNERFWSLEEIQEQMNANPVKTDEQKADIQKRWDERKQRNASLTNEQIVNHAEVSKKIGIAQGKEMSFEEANELYGNVNYSKGYGYQNNCQSCVVANELRRRGFDVTAQEYVRKQGNVPYELGKYTESAWIDPKTGQAPKSLQAGGFYLDKYKLKNKPISVLNNDLKDLTKYVGRYHIKFLNKGKGSSGHILTAERLTDGTLRIYDPQTGKIEDWVKVLSKKIRLDYGAKILRVDDLLINTDIIDCIVI